MCWLVGRTVGCLFDWIRMCCFQTFLLKIFTVIRLKMHNIWTIFLSEMAKKWLSKRNGFCSLILLCIFCLSISLIVKNLAFNSFQLLCFYSNRPISNSLDALCFTIKTLFSVSFNFPEIYRCNGIELMLSGRFLIWIIWFNKFDCANLNIYHSQELE